MELIPSASWIFGDATGTARSRSNVHQDEYSLRKFSPRVIYSDFAPSKMMKTLLEKNRVLIFLLIDCGYTLELPRQSVSNEYPQSMLWVRNKKNMFSHVYPNFIIIIKVGFKEYILHGHVFVISSFTTHALIT